MFLYQMVLPQQTWTFQRYNQKPLAFGVHISWMPPDLHTVSRTVRLTRKGTFCSNVFFFFPGKTGKLHWYLFLQYQQCLKKEREWPCSCAPLSKIISYRLPTSLIVWLSIFVSARFLFITANQLPNIVHMSFMGVHAAQILVTFLGLKLKRE